MAFLCEVVAKVIIHNSVWCMRNILWILNTICFITSIFLLGVCNNDERLVMACLLSLRICFMTSQVPSDLIYEDPNLVSTLVQLLKKSPHAAECASNILQRSCKVWRCFLQNLLCKMKSLENLNSRLILCWSHWHKTLKKLF